MDLLTRYKENRAKKLEQFDHELGIYGVVPAEETLRIIVCGVFECQHFSEVLIEIIEQVIFVQRILHMSRKLIEQVFFFFFMDCIIVILTPFILKEILKFDVHMLWVAKAIVELSHNTKEPVEVIKVLNRFVESQKGVHDLHEVIHNIRETCYT